MCNFVIQELNREAVIYGLSDPSGKARPMVLLTDIKPNGSGNYGYPIEAFQIGSICHNSFEIPVKIRWGRDYRTSYISPFHTLSFSAAEVFRCSPKYVGILPEEILELATSIHCAYIMGNHVELAKLEDAVKTKRVNFIHTFPEDKYIEYISAEGKTVRLLGNGSIQSVDEKSRVQIVHAPENSELSSRHRNFNAAGNDRPTAFDSAVSEDNSKAPDETKKVDPSKKLSKPLKVKKAEAVDAKKVDAKKVDAKKVDAFGWVKKRTVDKQSNEALKKFLHAMNDLSTGEIQRKCGFSSTSSFYHRKTAALEEISKRYNSGSIDLDERELEILFRFSDLG